MTIQLKQKESDVHNEDCQSKAQTRPEEDPSSPWENEEIFKLEDLSSSNEDDDVEKHLTQNNQIQEPQLCQLKEPSPPAPTRVLRDRSQIKPPVHYSFHH